MEKRQRKVKRRQQHLTDCIKGAVRSKSRSRNKEDYIIHSHKGNLRYNISQTQTKTKEWIEESV
jgi:hypothetical protein